MPRQTRIEKNRKPQHLPQETFRYTTPDRKVFARPIDAYVQPNVPAKPVMSKDAESLINALDSVTGSLNLMANTKALKTQRESKEGERLFMSGKELPENAPSSMAEAFEYRRGASEASKFTNTLKEYLRLNAQKPKVEFDQGLNKIYTEATRNQNDYFMSGFYGESQEAMQGVTNEYNRVQVELLQEDYLNNMSNSISNVIDKLVPNGRIYTSEKLHEMLQAFQVEGSIMGKGIPKKKISEVFLAKVAEIAIEDKNASLLDFVQIKDKSKIALIDNVELAEQIRRYESIIDSEIEAAEVDEKKRKTERRDTITVNLEKRIMDIQDGKSKESWGNILSELDKDRETLGPNNYKVLRTMIKDVRNGVTDRPNDSTTYADLSFRLFNMNPSDLPDPDEIKTAYAQGRINQNTYVSMLKSRFSLGSSGWNNNQTYKQAVGLIELRVPKPQRTTADNVFGTSNDSGFIQAKALMEFNRRVYDEAKSDKDVETISNEIINKYAKMETPDDLPEAWRTEYGILNSFINANRGYPMTKKDVMGAFSILRGRPVLWEEIEELVNPSPERELIHRMRMNELKDEENTTTIRDTVAIKETSKWVGNARVSGPTQAEHEAAWQEIVNTFGLEYLKRMGITAADASKKIAQGVFLDLPSEIYKQIKKKK